MAAEQKNKPVTVGIREVFYPLRMEPDTPPDEAPLSTQVHFNSHLLTATLKFNIGVAIGLGQAGQVPIFASFSLDTGVTAYRTSNRKVKLNFEELARLRLTTSGVDGETQISRPAIDLKSRRVSFAHFYKHDTDPNKAKPYPIDPSNTFKRNRLGFWFTFSNPYTAKAASDNKESGQKPSEQKKASTPKALDISSYRTVVLDQETSRTLIDTRARTSEFTEYLRHTTVYKRTGEPLIAFDAEMERLSQFDTGGYRFTRARVLDSEKQIHNFIFKALPKSPQSDQDYEVYEVDHYGNLTDLGVCSGNDLDVQVADKLIGTNETKIPSTVSPAFLNRIYSLTNLEATLSNGTPRSLSPNTDMPKATSGNGNPSGQDQVWLDRQTYEQNIDQFRRFLGD